MPSSLPRPPGRRTRLNKSIFANATKGADGAVNEVVKKYRAKKGLAHLPSSECEKRYGQKDGKQLDDVRQPIQAHLVARAVDVARRHKLGRQGYKLVGGKESGQSPAPWRISTVLNRSADINEALNPWSVE